MAKLKGSGEDFELLLVFEEGGRGGMRYRFFENWALGFRV